MNITGTHLGILVIVLFFTLQTCAQHCTGVTGAVQNLLAVLTTVIDYKYTLVYTRNTSCTTVLQSNVACSQQQLVCILLYTSMYKIQLDYAPRTFINDYIRDHRYEDVITQTACTKLLLNHNIHTTQPNHCTIEFESDRDRTLALLKLQNSDAYTARLVE